LRQQVFHPLAVTAFDDPRPVRLNEHRQGLDDFGIRSEHARLSR
jgi:hypothetical protein